jgi:tetratricopeptide (TPR) repeat protein
VYYQLIDRPSASVREEDLPRAVNPDVCNRIMFAVDTAELSTELTFLLGEACLSLDYLPIRGVHRGIVCSQRFLDVLTAASVSYRAYPASFLNKETSLLLPAYYSFWLPQSIHNAIDWERSEAWTNPETGQGWLTKIVLTAEVEAASPLLFHAHGTGRYFVHERLCGRLEVAEITGIAFAPLDTAYLPDGGVKKREMEQWLIDHPDDWVSWYRLSDFLVKARRYEEAVDALEQVLGINPNAEKAWYKLGHLLHQRGNLAEAQTTLKRAMKLQPQSLAWGEYCTILRTLEAKEEALAYAETWMKNWSQSPLPWYELGAAQVVLGRDQEALQAIDEGLARGGGARRDDLYLLKANILSKQERYEEALALFNRQLEVTPLKRVLWKGKMRALSALGRLDEVRKAEQEFQKLEQQREENLKKRPI